MPACTNCGANIAWTVQNCLYCGTENPAYTPPAVSIDALFAGAKAAMQAGQFQAAGELFQQVINTAPGTFDAYFSLAHCLMQLQRFADAATAMRQALELDSEHAMTLYNLGVILKASGQSQQARNYFEQAREQLKRNGYRYADTSYLESALKNELG